MLDRIREILTGQTAFQRWDKAIRKAEKQKPDYEILMKWERSAVEEFLRSDPQYRLPMESFFEEISYTWYRAGFVFQANRVMRDYEYWREVERKRRSDYERKQREERARRKEESDTKVGDEIPSHRLQVDENGFQDRTYMSDTDLEFVNLKYEKDTKPTKQAALPPTANTANLTATEEQMIENHNSPRLFISKARIIKPLFMAGKSDREISDELGEGFSERMVKYYCSIFRKTSPFK